MLCFRPLLVPVAASMIAGCAAAPAGTPASPAPASPSASPSSSPSPLAAAAAPAPVSQPAAPSGPPPEVEGVLAIDAPAAHTTCALTATELPSVIVLRPRPGAAPFATLRAHEIPSDAPGVRRLVRRSANGGRAHSGLCQREGRARLQRASDQVGWCLHLDGADRAPRHHGGGRFTESSAERSGQGADGQGHLLGFSRLPRLRSKLRTCLRRSQEVCGRLQGTAESRFRRSPTGHLLRSLASSRMCA